MTTDRGATPAEALVAADKARRLADDLAAGGVLAGIARHRIGAGDGDAPGVHCTIV